MNNELTDFTTDRISGWLKLCPQWINWKPVQRENGKIDKIPVDPVTLEPAKTNDRSTWTKFLPAVESARTNQLGIGFVFTGRDPFVGIDLDDCFENGQPKSWAKNLVDGFDSYAEITPSGKGLHIITRAKLPGKRRRKGKIETYESGRFFTVTGNSLIRYMRDGQDEMNNFYRDHFGEEPKTETKKPVESPTHTEDEILNGLKNYAPFQRLFAGDIAGYPSQSEADLALCNMIAKRTHNPQEIDSIFRESGLYREKWDQMRGSETYGQITIDKCLADAPQLTEIQITESKIIIKTIGELMTTKFPPVIDVISGGILPEAGGLILAGESEAGKSMLSMEIALKLALGRQLFDGNLLVPKKRKILVLQCENPEPQVQQRLYRMINGMNICVDELEDRIIFADPQTRYDLMGAGCIANVIDTVKQCEADVMIIDPLSSFHVIDENDNGRMRTVLDNITAISRQTGCAAIVIHHYGKPTEKRADQYRLRGASSIKDWADSIISVTRRKHEHKQMFMLRFDKIRHGVKPKPILCERDENFLSVVTEVEMLITPKQIQDFLKKNFPSGADTKTKLLNALKGEFDVSDSTAHRAINEAVDMKFIRELKGKGKSKKYVSM